MTWNKFNLKPWIISELKNNDYLMPTLIQTQVIPLALKHNNLIVSSPTGSGKTHAFLIPIINNIDEEKTNKVQAVIMTPTRELAQQTYHFTRELVKNSNIKVACFIGGKDLKQQEAKINASQPTIVIGTATRLKILYENNTLNITTANTLILDECDMLFEMGFVKELDFLISKMDTKLQFMVFSATINQELQAFLKKYITNSHFINLNKDINQPQIEHVFINCPHNQVEEQLIKLTNIINPYICLVFVNNKNEVNQIGQLLINANKKTALLHGGLTPRNRIQILKRIKNLEYQYLVCTDVGARGIDIPGVSHVISLRLPFELNYYLHRAGRTGRNNNSGISYVFFDQRDSDLLNKVKKLNINPKYYKIKYDELIPEVNLKQLKNNKSIKSNKDAILTINQFKSNAIIKPGYKKTFKKKMEKIIKIEKQEQKRKMIKAQRKKQKSFK